LKDFETQEKYRAFIQDKVGLENASFSSAYNIVIILMKVDDLWKRHPRGGAESDKEAANRREMQENILILFRESALQHSLADASLLYRKASRRLGFIQAK